MNERNERTFLAMAVCYLCFILGSCRTVPAIDTSKTDALFVDVIETQTEVITTGNDVANTIDDIKAITDDAKVSGEIPKEKVVKVIEYVDKSSIQVKALNEMISKQTGKISTLEKSRITDNADYAKAIADKQNEIDKAKIKASIFFRWALISTGIALILAGIIWLPKLLKAIL